MFPAACLICWLLGIFLSGYLGSNILVFILPLFVTVFWLGSEMLTSRVTKRKIHLPKTLLKALILLLIPLCSALHYQGFEQIQFEKAVSLCRENPVSLTGVVSGDVNRYNKTDYCTLTLEDGINVSVKIRTDKSLFPGEKVTLQNPALSVIHPENRTATKTRQMLGNDTFLSASFPYEPTVIRHGVKNYWLYGSKLLRNSAKEHFAKQYPEQTASFLTALLSSDKSMMDTDLYQEFLDTGTVHIVVVSGMHFSFLASALLFLSGLICQSRRKRLGITLPLLVVFAWFTGGTIPVMRSLLMISILFCYDILYIKPVKSYLVVLAIACLFTTVTPTLILNPSFLLTFGATFGITAFYEPLRTVFDKLPSQYLKNHLAMYLAVQPFTLPVVLLYFSRLPGGAVVANFLVAPLVSPILILSVLGMAVSTIPLTGTLILRLTTLLTKCFLFLIHCSAKISRPLNISLGEIPYLLWIGFGGLLFLCKTKCKPKRTAAAVFAAVFFITALTYTIFPVPKNELSVTFMGAKNTNSAVITTPADRLILYGTLQDIAYGRGSSYGEYAPVALMILTDLPIDEKTDTLLQELPDAPVICPVESRQLAKNCTNTVLLNENLTTAVDGIRIRLIADSKGLYEAEFSYQDHLFSFSQNADYILRNSHKNPDKIWIANFLRSSRSAEQLQKIPDDFRILSKKCWHPSAKEYDNNSLIKFRNNQIVFYGTKEQNPLWN